MVYNSFRELLDDYPTRDKMSFEEEIAFVEDAFDTYEHIGFADTFQSPYEECEEYNGLSFKVLGRVSYSAGEADLEVLPMWHILLENGRKVDAYPEEICLEERKD